MSLRFVLLASLLAFSPLSAQDDTEKNPTDAKLTAAMERDPSTAGMVEALATADAEWDARMNAAYKSLKKIMKPEEWASLVTAQKAWISFRDAQKKSFDATYSLMEGTMYIPMAVDSEMQLVRDRARFLEGYLSMIEGREE